MIWIEVVEKNKTCLMLNIFYPYMWNLNYLCFFNTYVLFTSLAQIITRYGTFIQANYCSFQLSSHVIATLKTVHATNWYVNHKLLNIFFNFCCTMSSFPHWKMYLYYSVLILYYPNIAYLTWLYSASSYLTNELKIFGTNI